MTYLHARTAQYLVNAIDCASLVVRDHSEAVSAMLAVRAGVW